MIAGSSIIITIILQQILAIMRWWNATNIPQHQQQQHSTSKYQGLEFSLNINGTLEKCLHKPGNISIRVE